MTFCPKDGTALVPDDSQIQSRVGTILADRYRIVRLLGEGGMGEVFEAEHIYIKKKVALKLLRSEITSNAEAVTRFHQEALAASTIGHENIVIIDDFGRLPDGSVYLTMEYLQGQPLSDLMLKGRLSPDHALEVIMQICRGLSAAHSKGIVHRDMKPENVYLVNDKEGRELAKILDFGIAKVSTADSGQNLTRTGTIFGTPHYMSPEQAMGRQLDHRTDIYSVGVIMYELFTGTVPFKAESFMGILTQHITALPQPPRTCAPDRDIHPEIERIILTAMNKEPERRYPSMVELLEDLQNARRTVTGIRPAVAPAPGGGWGTTHGTAAAMPVAHPTGPGGAAPPPTMHMQSVPPGTRGMPTGPMAPGTGPMAPGMGGMAPGMGGMTPPPGTLPGSAYPSSPSMAGMPAAHVSSSSLPPGQIHTGRSGGGGKVAILIVALLLVAGGGGAAAWFFLFHQGEDGDKKESSKEKVASKDGDLKDGGPKDGMDPMDGDAMGTRPAVDSMDREGPRTDPLNLPDAMDTRPAVDGMDGMDAMDAMDAEPTSVSLLTTPRGASVTKDGNEVCRTPCPVKVPTGGSETFVLKLKGHEAKTVTVAASGPSKLNFKLHREGGGSTSARVREPPPPMREVVIAARRRPPERPIERRPPMRRGADPFSEGID